MIVNLSDKRVEDLRLDAKTLVDISRAMEIDGRFKVIPHILDSIAGDILCVVSSEAKNKAEEMVAAIKMLEELMSGGSLGKETDGLRDEIEKLQREVIDRARVQKYEPNA